MGIKYSLLTKMKGVGKFSTLVLARTDYTHMAEKCKQMVMNKFQRSEQFLKGFEAGNEPQMHLCSLIFLSIFKK